MAMAHIIDPLRPKGLKPLSARLVDPQSLAGQDDLHKAMREQKWTWETVPANFPGYWIYGAFDPVLTSHVIDELLPQIEANPQWKAIYDLEMGVTRVVAKMETRGVLVDIPYIEQKRQDLVNYVNSAEAWIRETYKVPKLTPIGLRKWFEEQEIPFLQKRTKGGAAAFDKEVVKSIDHPVATTILAIRKADKLIGYLNKFLELRDDDGRLHANFWTMGTRTARMSITDPALQTLPKKDTTIRSAVIPSPGCALVSFDMDQVEARLMAIFSKSKAMLESFREAKRTGGDFFCMIASQIYGETITDKKDPRRQVSKTSVYGLIYGGGLETLARNAGVTIPEMSEFLSDFHTHYPEVRAMQQELMNLAKARQKAEGMAYVKTPDGRRLVVDDDKDYTATNYLIQSHAAEIMKKKLVLIDSILPEGCHILLLVHDEMLLEIPVDILEETMAMIEEALNRDDLGDYPLPLTWGGDFSTISWGDLVD
jgi:DNA polymerase-1